MKKWLLAIILLLLITVAGIFYLLPAEINIASVITVDVNQHPGYRAIINEAKWRQWWPGKAVKGEKGATRYYLDEVSYQPNQKLFEGMEVLIETRHEKLNSVLIIEPLSLNRSLVRWKTTFAAGGNPLSRLRNYTKAKAMKDDMAGILATLKVFMEKQENVYDIQIRNEMVKDTFLVTLKTVHHRYPEMSTVYSMIDTLRRFLLLQGAKATNAPMLHIQPLEGNKFEVMVALPLDRKLEDQPPVFFKRMVPGHILAAEVKGGRYSINAALNQLENYMDDYKKVSPALPFESLITDRLKEPDTSRWITKLYYPVF